MQPLLKMIQRMSQKRLNGMPKTIGVIRSHNGTEKHMPANGTRPIATAGEDGRLIGPFRYTRSYAKSMAITS